MAPLHLLLVVCFIGGISGQTTYIFDVGTNFQRSINGAASTVFSSVSSTNRESCVSGGTLYYTSSNTVIRQSPSAVLFTAPSGQNIVSISCFCNVLAVALQPDDSTQGIWIQTLFLNRPHIIIKAHSTVIQGPVLLQYVSEISTLLIVSTSGVWGISLMDASSINGLYTFTTALTPGIFDITYTTNSATTAAGGFDLFALTGFSGTAHISYNGVSATVTPSIRSIVPGTNAHAIGAGNNLIYVLTADFTTTIWILRSYTIATFLTNNHAGTTVITGTPHQFTTSSFLINGLHVCDSTCQSFNCASVTCSCASSVCGACADTTSTCQCINSALTQCCYSSNAADCLDCIDPIDACVFVRNPLALRRSGAPIDVVAVSTVNAVITLKRLVDAGRYLAPNLPQRNQFPIVNGPTIWVNGYSFPLQAIGRGRRFGVYTATFSPINNDPINLISAIATENSGFTNTFYSYTANQGETVTLKASFAGSLTRFINDVFWKFSRVDQTTGLAVAKVVPPCVFTPDRLNCRLVNVIKATHEGVYESYRRGRNLRNWHPIFYLFVRPCPANRFGDQCTPCSFTCVHGVCDIECGRCVCSPGWSGLECNTACVAANLVGRNCGINCDLIFTASINADCKGLMISNPAKVGFACRSGLMPPQCEVDCLTGFWGPNCLRTCATTPCDARTGP